MNFVSMDNGSLLQVMTIIARELDNDALKEVLEAVQQQSTVGPTSASNLSSQTPPGSVIALNSTITNALPKSVVSFPPPYTQQGPGVPRTEVTWSVSTSAPVEGTLRASDNFPNYNHGTSTLNQTDVSISGTAVAKVSVQRQQTVLPAPASTLLIAASTPLPTTAPVPSSIPLAPPPIAPPTIPLPSVPALQETLLKFAFPAPVASQAEIINLDPSILLYGRHVTLESLASGGLLDSSSSTLLRGGTWGGRSSVWEIVRGRTPETGGMCGPP